MRRLFLTAAVGSVALTFASPVLAASPIDGTWKIDTATAKLSKKPDVWSIKGGTYDCTSCTPPYKIAADGKAHPVAGRDYWDAAAISVVDAKTLSMTRYRAGAEVGTTKLTLSADGKMLTYISTSSDNAKGTPITNTSMSKRVGPAPAGAHAASGSWEAVNDGAQLADDSLIATMSMAGDIVTFSLPTGEHYTAKLGGPQVPFIGDKAGATVTVTASGTGFTETDYLKGAAIATYTYVPTGATTMTLKAVNLKAKTTDEFTLKKQ